MTLMTTTHQRTGAPLERFNFSLNVSNMKNVYLLLQAMHHAPFLVDRSFRFIHSFRFTLSGVLQFCEKK